MSAYTKGQKCAKEGFFVLYILELKTIFIAAIVTVPSLLVPIY